MENSASNINKKIQKQKVLIVDDNVEICQLLSDSLLAYGYEVAVAHDGTEGLQKAKELEPEIIFTDIEMPRMDGHTFARRIMSQKLRCAVVIISGTGGMDDVVDAMRNGAVDFLKKPWKHAELVTAVERASESVRLLRTAAPVKDSPPVSAASPGTPERKAVVPSITERLKRGEMSLPVVPAVVAKLRMLVKQPATTVDEVAGLIEQDPHITTQMLRLSNSTFYARGHRSNDVKVALNRVGFRKIQNMAETIYAQNCFALKDASLRLLQEKTWRYSVARAVAMRTLVGGVPVSQPLAAPAGPRPDPETAYLAGLLSDIGVSFLLWVMSEKSAAGPGEAAGSQDSILASLREHHQKMGSVVLRQWGTEQEVALSALCHHPNLEIPPGHLYWKFLVVSAELADQLAPGDDISRTQPFDSSVVSKCKSELGISAELLARLRVQLQDECHDILNSLA